MEVCEKNVEHLRRDFAMIKHNLGGSLWSVKVEESLMLVAKAALRFENPVKFGTSCGVIFSLDCLALELSILTKLIGCSRSTVGKSLRKEDWVALSPMPQGIKHRIKQIVGDAEVKRWSVRSYPPNSHLASFVAENDRLCGNTVELTLQKDIYSWTCFNEAPV